MISLKFRLIGISIAVSLAFIHTHERHGHAHSANFHGLSSRAVFDGFQIVEPGSLESLGLGATCEQVLYQPLKCDNYTARFSTPKYRRRLGDKGLTASVCDSSCSGALTVFSRRVNSACTAKKEIYPGYPTAALIDTIWGGWNETCLMDANKSQYCNGKQDRDKTRRVVQLTDPDIIESWAPVDELEAMPKDNLCSYCYTKKLATMQANKFGVYALGGYQETYNYAVKSAFTQLDLGLHRKLTK